MHFSTSGLDQILSTWGYLAVFAFVAIESSGIPFPGETMLIAAAAYAGAGHLQIPFVIGAAAAGAITGDNIGYLVGRTGGRELALRYGKYIHVDEARLATAEEFFQKHGDKTVFLGRFVAILRAWAAFLAGLNRMPWPKFFFFNASGGITWATLYGILAFELGKNLPLLDKVVKTIGYGGLALVVIAAVVLFFLRRRSKKLRAEARAMEQLQGAPGNDSIAKPVADAGADRDDVHSSSP
ncbi:MAG TPA: DedA family protein [Chloroflexota bacterium]